MNNFDKSSTGCNIDITLQYDSILAQERFTENFKCLEDDIYLYTDFRNSSEEFTITIIETNLLKLKTIVIDNDLNYYYDNDTDLTITEYIDCIEQNFTGVELYNYCLNNNIAILERYKTMTVTGCSQGDKATILVNTTEFKNVGGSEFNPLIHGVIFEHYFYNQPLYCLLNINDEDYNVEFKNEYAYYDIDLKDEIIAWCMKNVNVTNKCTLNEQLRLLLPMTL